MLEPFCRARAPQTGHSQASLCRLSQHRGSQHAYPTREAACVVPETYFSHGPLSAGVGHNCDASPDQSVIRSRWHCCKNKGLPYTCARPVWTCYVWYMHSDREAESTADYLGFYLAMGCRIRTGRGSIITSAPFSYDVQLAGCCTAGPSEQCGHNSRRFMLLAALLLCLAWLQSITMPACSRRAGSSSIHLDPHLAPALEYCGYHSRQESTTGLTTAVGYVLLQTTAAHVEASIPVIRLN